MTTLAQYFTKAECCLNKMDLHRKNKCEESVNTKKCVLSGVVSNVPNLFTTQFVHSSSSVDIDVLHQRLGHTSFPILQKF